MITGPPDWRVGAGGGGGGEGVGTGLTAATGPPG